MSCLDWKLHVMISIMSLVSRYQEQRDSGMKWNRCQIQFLIESSKLKEVTYPLVVPFCDLHKAMMDVLSLLVIQSMVQKNQYAPPRLLNFSVIVMTSN